ncbi:MAG: DUF1819 domain-containing protein [Myxococcales bacterium]|nr:DUF1819 domain-containing protein [Myxococcales bacterium]MCB9735987.1 DUF1819 domain-containing protein [Deltaproteobacteria bacterium]
MKCALEVEESRAYWRHAGGDVSPQRAFDAYWFGAKSLSRVEVLIANMRARFDAFPPALDTLHRWTPMSPDTRRVLCHWHLQLADPLYRAFTGELLVARRDAYRAEVTRDVVVSWVRSTGPVRWTTPTHIQLASKLLSAAFAAGLVATNRDPRPLASPRVGDDALSYLMYLLRGVDIGGSLLDNPYLASVGLAGADLEARLRQLPGLAFRRQGDLVDFRWEHADLAAWADAYLPAASGSEPPGATP